MSSLRRYKEHSCVAVCFKLHRTNHAGWSGAVPGKAHTPQGLQERWHSVITLHCHLPYTCLFLHTWPWRRVLAPSGNLPRWTSARVPTRTPWWRCTLCGARPREPAASFLCPGGRTAAHPDVTRSMHNVRFTHEQVCMVCTRAARPATWCSDSVQWEWEGVGVFLDNMITISLGRFAFSRAAKRNATVCLQFSFFQLNPQELTFGCAIPRASNSSGCFTGNSITSFISLICLSRPPTMSYVESGTFSTIIKDTKGSTCVVKHKRVFSWEQVCVLHARVSKFTLRCQHVLPCSAVFCEVCSYHFSVRLCSLAWHHWCQYFCRDLRRIFLRDEPVWKTKLPEYWVLKSKVTKCWHSWIGKTVYESDSLRYPHPRTCVLPWLRLSFCPWLWQLLPRTNPALAAAAVPLATSELQVSWVVAFDRWWSLSLGPTDKPRTVVFRALNFKGHDSFLTFRVEFISLCLQSSQILCLVGYN